jgi:hypothetical protein
MSLRLENDFLNHSVDRNYRKVLADVGRKGRAVNFEMVYA